MQDLNNKVNNGGATAAGQLSADEWNQLPSEIQNVIEGLGIILSGGDLNQLGKAIAGYASNGDFYTDGGAADAYVLSVIGLKQAPHAYIEGMRIRFIPGNDNTGSSTVNVAGLGLKNITNTSSAGIIKSGVSIELVYNSTSGEFEIQPRAILTEQFLSAEQIITAAGSLTLAHSLSASPSLIQARLICKVAEHGYSIGDELIVSSGPETNGTAAGNGLSNVLDATNINIRFGSQATTFAILNKTTGVTVGITNANWRLIMRAWV